MRKFWFLTVTVLLLLGLILPAGSSRAQSSTAAGPVYIVQEGDYFQDIAYRLHVSAQELARINNISDTNLITIGSQLIVPGLEGIQGELTTAEVAYGETLHSLSVRYHISAITLERLNHLTSPDELYAGDSIWILKESIPPADGKRTTLGVGQSLLELAVLNQADTWSLLAGNQLNYHYDVLPGDVLRISGQSDSSPGGLPPAITSIDISPIIQGKTVEVKIMGAEGSSLSGSLLDHPLNLYPIAGANQTALQGVNAMTQPGLYPLTLMGSLPDGTSFTFSQNVRVAAGQFNRESLFVDPATLDPAITGPEDAQWMSLASKVSPEQMWQGIFTIPVEPVFGECYASLFGTRRSYNWSEFKYFHTGVDYCGQVGDPIYAAAAGVVVFTGLLTVRGNATMIDHGHGVFSAYLHQSEILVKVGDRVEQGQLIGRVGNTGRVEGPHLHFEVLVGGVQVNPLDWLKQVFP